MVGWHCSQTLLTFKSGPQHGPLMPTTQPLNALPVQRRTTKHQTKGSFTCQTQTQKHFPKRVKPHLPYNLNRNVLLTVAEQ